MGTPLPKPLALGKSVGVVFHWRGAKHLLAGAAQAVWHLVVDEEPAVFFDDFENDLEVFLWRSDEAADALDRLGDKSGDVSARAGLNEVFDVVGASYFAGWIGQMQRAAVAVGIDRVRNADAYYAALAIPRMRSDCFG